MCCVLTTGTARHKFRPSAGQRASGRHHHCPRRLRRERGATVNSYVRRPITATGTYKSILAGVMKETLMHVHNRVTPVKYERAVSYMSTYYKGGVSYEGRDELNESC